MSGMELCTVGPWFSLIRLKLRLVIIRSIELILVLQELTVKRLGNFYKYLGYLERLWVFQRDLGYFRESFDVLERLDVLKKQKC